MGARRWLQLGEARPGPLLEMAWPRSSDKAGYNPQVARDHDIPLV